MKIRKFASIATFALAVFSVAFAARAIETGDIYSIDLVEGGLYGGHVPTAENPLTAGESQKAIIRVRLVNRGYDNVSTSKPWRFAPTSSYLSLDPGVQNGFEPQLGLMIGGERRYASYVGQQETPTPAKKFTDIFFEYVPKLGDLSMPALLMNANGEPATSEISVDYALNNSMYWQLTNDDGDACVFHFCPQNLVPAPDEYWTAGEPNRCISGYGMGLYIKTIDFDSIYDVPAETPGEVNIWRQIHKGRTTTAKGHGLPSVAVEGGATAETSSTLYVWVPPEDIGTASPLTTEAHEVTDTYKVSIDGATVTETRWVLPVSVLKGSTGKTFAIKGVAEGRARVRMSSSEHLVCDEAGVLVTNWVERTVEVVPPPKPYIAFTLFDPVGNLLVTPVTCSADYQDCLARLVVELSEAPTDTVRVNINPDLADGDIFDDGLLGISPSTDGSPWSIKRDYVEFGPGEQVKELFIYGKGSTKKLADDGVTFTPTATGAGASIYTGENVPATLRVKYATPVLVKPTAADKIEDAMAGQTYSLDVVLSDSYKYMREDYTFKYRIKINGTVGSWQTLPPCTIDPDSGEGTIDIDFEDEGEGTIELYALNADSRPTAHVNVPVVVAAPKKAWATLDRPGGYYSEGETAKVRFELSQKTPGSKVYYAFLVPVEGSDDSTNKFSSIGFSTSVPATGGCPIAPGSKDSGDGFTEIAVLDGNAVGQYDVFICTQSTYSQTKSAGYSAGRLVIHGTNVVPVVNRVSMGTIDIDQSGTKVPKAVAQGVEKTFRMEVFDPSTFDLDGTDETAEGGNDNRFVTQWKFGSDSISWETHYGNPNENPVTHTFVTPGDQVVKVRVQDKDMRKPAAPTESWSQEFTFTVTVLNVPSVVITQVNGPVYEETQNNLNESRFNVSLTTPPDFASPDDKLVVKLAVELIGDPAKYSLDGCVLSKDQVEFRNGSSDGQYFYLKELDGTPESMSRGFRIVATVTPESQALDVEGKRWDPAECEITVLNTNPVILAPNVSFDTEGKPIATPVTVGQNITLGWSLSDVVPDYKGMTVTWTTSEGETKTYKQGEEGLEDVMSGKHTFSFNSTGEKSVTIVAEDKDGGRADRTVYYTIAASKTIEMVPQGPASGNGTALSARYHDKAEGLGEGRIWAENFAKVQDWIFKYNCGLDSKWRVYGKGYAIGEEDTVVNGNGGPKGAGAGYVYDPEDGRESFLYAWLQIVQEEDSAKPTDEYLAVVPEHRESKNSGTLVNLPTEQADDGSYPSTILEAIFAREYLVSDNMGDINQDGVPDIYAKKYDFQVYDEDGNVAGDDLKKITVINENGNIDEDYLPNTEVSAYASLIPGLAEKWATPTHAFDAVTEIRGYDRHLNDAPALVGIVGVKPDIVYAEEVGGEWKWTENCTISEVEFMAWTEWATANIGKDAWKVEANWKLWSPERPTDPCSADTDDDGIPDGYEYYFWYLAHVGTLDGNGVHRYLTGRRYDQRNPGEGKFIPSVVIARLMDPRSDFKAVDVPTEEADRQMLTVLLAEDPDERDTDNDGLPDSLEFQIGTNPFDFDTDGDGLADGWEIMIAGLDPLLANSSADGLVDTVRNYDGDAMAISSYALENLQVPVPVNFEHAKRWTFAVIDEDGDSDGVQWYATAEDPAAYIKEGEPLASWWKITVADVDYCSVTEPVLTADGRLASTLVVYTLAADGEDSVARGYPTRLFAGVKAAAEEAAEELKVYEIGEEVPADKANACWIYGKGSADALKGEVAKTAAEYGCLALGRQKGATAGKPVCALPSDKRDVAFLHYLCYQEFKFDPRTAWNEHTPLAKRWGKTIDGQAVSDTTKVGQGAYAGIASRTRAYTAYDEFLVCSFFENNGCDMTGFTPVVDDAAPYMAKYWAAFTTNPQGPGEPGLISSEHYYGRQSDQGADTDLDGVPDGWELYVMSGPKKAGAYVFANPYAGFETAGGMLAESLFSPFVGKATDADTTSAAIVGSNNADDLTELREYAGTDSCNYYSTVQDGNTVAYSTTIVRPAKDAHWLNKFFPTDPWNRDTDRDGIIDSMEGVEGSPSYSFIYGNPVDNGVLWSIPGGGLNPCSVDTDRDGLPDGWELQFKGTPDSIYAGDGAEYAKDENDVEVGGNPLQGLTDGMDGTVADAFNYPRGMNGKYTHAGTYVAFNQVVDRDYDHDGLDNWQEYLTGTMRCWRYDDPVTPMTYIPSSLYFKDGKFDVENAVTQLMEAGLLESETAEDAVGEFWYKTLVDASNPLYNPHFVTDTSSGAQYFSRVDNVWDVAYIDANLTGGEISGAYYWFMDRVDDNYFGNTWAAAWKALGVEKVACSPLRYASCSPIDPDSDHDGMDDYYELFHGMNPLLGTSGVKGFWWLVNSSGSKNDGEGFDIVYDSYVGWSDPIPQAWGASETDPESFMNYWQRKAEADGVDFGKGSKFNFTVFPWLNGLATADADGDGTRNQEEAVMPMIAPTTAWHHTDPTALWMTDSSYSNSLVRIAYRLPIGTDKVDVGGEKTFTYKHTVDEKEVEETFNFTDFDGFTADGFVRFNPDLFWSLSAGADKMNWIASFEENEGYDSDHDGVNDQDELAGKFRGKTDPLDADSPRRRQAMYFQGKERPSALQTMPFVREQHPDASQFNKYPDDLSFLQYTVECWVKPDTAEDATIIERACWTDESNPADREFLRCNFRLGIRGGKWYTKFDPNDTTKASVSADSGDVAAMAGEWTHLAATYDGDTLRLYVNGMQQGFKQSGLQPAYGSSSVTVDGMAGVHARPGMTYWRDREYALHAIVFGASFVTCGQGAADGSALDVTRAAGWERYTNFFKGYIDEVRIWDGARSAAEIAGAMGQRFTPEDAAKNREAFYAEWAKAPAAGSYCGRYAKDGSGNPYSLPAELRFHWAFDSVFGAVDEARVAKVPSGFNYTGDAEVGGRAMLTRPAGYVIDWWNKILEGYGSVYDDPAWIEWIPNTVTHLPRFDGTTLDSRYWSEDFAGAANGTYRFARTAEPVSFWTQYRRGGIAEGGLAYSSTGSRQYFASEYDETNRTEFAKLYEFTGRHLNQTGDDLLPLGGAFVKQCEEMWDEQGASSNWEINGGSADSADGIPAWWASYANDMYYDGDEEITWETMVKWPTLTEGMPMTAGEAYLRDLARGYVSNDAGDYAVTDGSEGDFRQRYDMDANGLPDWWEELHGISGADIYADTDKDGLPNYIEYLLSEVFEFKGIRFSPVNPHSVDPYTSDYFYRVGDLYVGEIFTDHDQVDDTWEDIYPNAFGSRLLYDAGKDADADGWSNRSEVRYAKQCMPTQADKQTHYSAADGLVADYPIPTLALTLNYNGANQTAVREAPIVVQVTRNPLDTAAPDATFVVGQITETQAGTGTSSVKGSEQTKVALTRTLGKWSNRHALGTLTPGYINKDSVALQFCYDPSSLVYTWEVDAGSGFRIKRGTRIEYDADRRKYGETNVNLLSRDTEYKELENVELRTAENSSVATWVLPKAGIEFGTLDLTTGAFDINLGAFAGQYVVNSTNAEDYASMEDQTYRITYAVNPAVDLPRKLYLGEATTGWIREGKNQIEAFADLNSNGAFDPGEPYGIINGVDVSWKGTSATIELTEASPATTRISLFGAEGGASKGGSSSGGQQGGGSGVAGYPVRTVQQIYTELEESIKAQNLPPVALSNALANLNWRDTNVIVEPTIDSTEDVRVRVVRWLVDGNPVWACGVEPRVVLDKKFHAGTRGDLTEADILSESAFDLDWQYLRSEVVSAWGVQSMQLPVAEVDYLVVIGDGVTAFMGKNDTNNVVKALSQVVCRRYGASRVTAVTTSPSASGDQIVRSANPTFKWKIAETDENGYTAFKLQVSDAKGGLVYDSGIQPAPARDVNGNYVWSAPLYAGDKGTNGIVYANNAGYSWKVSMYNAKYRTDSYSSAANYLAAVPTNSFEYGTANVAVRYFGPKLSYAGKTIRVRAYTSPDFTGLPVAAGYVAEPDDVETGVSVTGRRVGANCQVIGIPAGTYYLQAFIDSNNNGVCDAWESMGYLCGRDTDTVDWLNPVAMTFGPDSGKGDLAVIYIEDADTDCDSIPDAWEFAKYGNLTEVGAEAAELTPVGEAVAALKDFNVDLKVAAGNDILGGLAGRIMTTLTSSRSLAALSLGLDPEQVTVGADGTATLKSTVKAGTLAITAFNFNRETGKVELKVTADVQEPERSGIESPLYKIVVADGATVTVKVWYSDSLAEKPHVIRTIENVVISSEGINGNGLITATVEGLAEKATGYVSLEIVQ